MSISTAYFYNFAPDGSNPFVTATITGAGGGSVASAGAAIPAATENLMVQGTGFFHVRVGTTSGTTATQNDPLMSGQQGPVILKLPVSVGTTYYVSFIADASVASGTIYCNYGKIAEA